MSILALETKKYAIKIENFEGPLDLLCHLIEKNKMNIYDINLSEITEQYIEYLRQMESMDLEIASEFLVMASTLLFLKSKKLLPKQEEEEEELTEEELIRRIIEYKKFKEISKTLKEQYLENSNRYYKNQEEIELPKQKIEKEYNNLVIPTIYKNLVERNRQKINQNAKNIEKIAITDNYTVASKVKEMYKILVKQKRFVFNKFYSLKKRNKQEVVTAFSGLLEMSRRSKVQTKQEELFGDINVELNKESSKNR
ncbi:MAG: segregation and condensation protein A [Clostridia bacterium]